MELFKSFFNFLSGIFSKKSRLIVYGDIHGCLDKFKFLREKIGVRSDDIEVCAGDIVTKGKYSVETLKFIRKNNILTVLGNHEDKLVRYLGHQERSPQKKNPIKLDADEANIIKKISKEDISYLQKLPVFLQFGKFTIVHGGLQNYMDLQDLKKRDKAKILRMRYLDITDHFVALDKVDENSIFWGDVYDGKSGFVVFGHKRSKEVIEREHCLGLDTGCVYGGDLSAAVINDVKKIQYEIVQV